MNIEIVAALIALAWIHGRFYPWSFDISQRLWEARQKAKFENHLQRQEQARYDKENGNQA